jgi:hypothetical protein
MDNLNNMERTTMDSIMEGRMKSDVSGIKKASSNRIKKYKKLKTMLADKMSKNKTV